MTAANERCGIGWRTLSVVRLPERVKQKQQLKISAISALFFVLFAVKKAFAQLYWRGVERLEG